MELPPNEAILDLMTEEVIFLGFPVLALLLPSPELTLFTATASVSSATIHLPLSIIWFFPLMGG
jgi:hypothetical protein